MRTYNNRALQKPIILYHGSKSKQDFSDFKYDKNNQTGTDYGEAYYFTPDLIKAKGYSYDLYSDPRVMEIKNERDRLFNNFRNSKSEEDRQAYLQYVKTHDYFKFINDEDYDNPNYPKQALGIIKKVNLDLKNPYIADAKGKYYYNVYPQYFDEARKNGNDGIIVKNVIDNPHGKPRPIDVYIAFNKNQIKNIKEQNYGKNNKR